MAEPRFSPSERDLERALADLGRELAYPPTPQLAVSVQRRLAEEAALPGRRWPWLPRLDRRFAVAFAAVLALVAVVLAVSPAARDAVAERLGLRGVQINQVPSVTAPRATQLNLGEPLTLDQV